MSYFPRTVILACLFTLVASVAEAQETISIGANVNMVSGLDFPNGDPFQRQQNEPSVAYSSRNNLHLLAGANDYRAVDVPGLPGGRETGDSWLSYFWSTNGGATWQSTLIPGYPQDPACQGPNPPVLCAYAAGADPVVRAGANGMFYYSGIVFDRADPTRSAIFLSRFIDLNNDEGGEPIRYIDTTIIDANNDGAVFLDKSWIAVDIPRGQISDTLTVVQSNGTSIDQTVACGNVYVGYAAIGGEGQDLRSEIRMATSADCGNVWNIQSISEPDTLNQGANIAIHPLNGDVHVAWRRFDTVESFLGISPTGCPASPAAWEVNSDWPVSSIELGGDTYTIAEAQALLATKHRGDESIKLAYEVIAAKLNLLTGGGDPVDGFNPWQWAQTLQGFIDDAEAWFVDNPIGSDPKQQAKQSGKVIKNNIQQILQGSGTCAGDSEGSPGGTTGDTNAILITSSDDLGETFGPVRVVDESTTFDQGSTRFSFRTTAYPTVAADADGRIYVAWAARGFATIRNQVSDGDARIVVSTSGDGVLWSDPLAVDEPNREGHQIKPSLLFAGGQLTLVFYDFRQDVSNIFEGFVVDLPEEDRLRHTVDVRLATALPAAAPVFTDYSLVSGHNDAVRPSSQASRYNFVAYGDSANATTLQLEYMVPNFPMFADGTTPFIGDYVDIAAPNLINDDGVWRFATNPGDVQVWQAVWADNRDVIPPPDGDWSKYVAPISQAQPSFFDPTVTIASCNDVTFPDSDFPAGSLYTGTRNQNVYSASISNGLIVAAPGNNRPLTGFDTNGLPLDRSFVVYVQNTTAQARQFTVSLPSIPMGVQASLALDEPVTTKDIVVGPYSSGVVTVFASLDFAPTSEAIRVAVEEVGGTLSGSVLLNSDSGAPEPLTASLLTSEVHNPAILNPAILNPAILNASVDATAEMSCTDDPVKCVLNPAIFNPAILNPAILNPAIFNPAILNPAIFNPAILNPAIFNPAILNPAILNPAIMNPAILNPAILNPAIFNPAIFNPAILNPAILNPAILNPTILNPAILNPAILNPAILNPAILNPAILNPAILNTAPTSEPQQVDVTFAVENEGNATTAYDLNLAAPELEGLSYELLVYRLNETPVAQGCELTTEAQQQLIFRQDDPLNTDLDGSFYLEPGEQVLVTFRVLPDADADVPLNPVDAFDVTQLGALVSAQPVNSDATAGTPADEFGPPANIVLGTAGGAAIGAGGTAPAVALSLTNGESVSVSASGFVSLGFGFPLATPDGNGAACPANCLLPGAPAASLVARIGTGPWELVGEGPTILTASADGDLEFGINDNGYSDNTGAFYVTVTPIAQPSFVVTSFDPTLVYSGSSPAQQDALNAAVGVTGYTIEDFEDTTLVDGLTLSGGAFGLSINSTFPDATWDGVSYYVDQVLTGGGVQFNIAAGTRSFGIGLGDIDIANVNLIVNGEDLGAIPSLPNFRKLGDNFRDVYLRVDAAPGESITTVLIQQQPGSSFSDGVFFDHVAFEQSTEFVERVILDETDILNDGVLIAANDLGAFPGVATVNGVTFGVDQTGAAPGEWRNGGGDFSLDPFSPALDELLSDLIYADFGRQFLDTTFTIGGLTPGNRYRLQLLFSNDANVTGNDIELTVASETYLFNGWQPSAVNLIREFVATGTSVDIVSTGGVASDNASGRIVLNAYALHDISVSITAATPAQPSPGFGQLVTFMIPGVSNLTNGTDIVFARNDVTGVTTSGSNFVFGGTTVRLDGALRPVAGTNAGTVWIEYGNGDRSNDFPITFSAVPAAPVLGGVFTASACFDFAGTQIDPAADTVVAGDWVRITAQGLDSATSRVDVLTTQPTTGITSTDGLCSSTDGSSYFVQIPNGVDASPFTLQIRANQTSGGGAPGDYATINLNQ